MHFMNEFELDFHQKHYLIDIRLASNVIEDFLV